MSITVQFSVSAKRKNSTFIPVMRDSAECTFKNGCSMLNPTLLLNIRTDTFPDYTFFKIDNRIYEITDIRTVRNDLFEIDGRVDVLATYKNEIGASTQYVIRSASTYDGGIIDTKYPTKNSVVFDSKPFRGDLVTKINSTGFYVVGVKTDASRTGLAFYALNATNMGALVQYMYAGLWLNAGDVSIELQKMLCDPMDYISCCYWYPFSLSDSLLTDPVRFGYFQSNAYGYIIPESGRVQILYDTISIEQHPQAATRGKYLNGAPYTRATASVYGFGRIPLDTNFLIDSQLIGAYIRVDLFTGVAELSLGTGQGLLSKTSTMFGVPIQLSQITQDLVKPLVSALNASSAVANGDVLGALKGIGSAITSGLSPQVQTSGSFGSKIAFEETPSILSEWYLLADEDNPQIGRPLCSPVQISNLSGYVLCENAEISLAATEQEKLEVLSYLNNGFFYE
jgi:hypothetical protein